jgi:hypothetical protein
MQVATSFTTSTTKKSSKLWWPTPPCLMKMLPHHATIKGMHYKSEMIFFTLSIYFKFQKICIPMNIIEYWALIKLCKYNTCSYIHGKLQYKWKCGNVQIYRSDTDKLRADGIQRMLVTIQFWIFCLPPCYIKMKIKI